MQLVKAEASGNATSAAVVCWHVQELTWLVRNLVASGNMFEAERLLAGYVLARRNALSSTAAIEYALIKVSRPLVAGQHDRCCLPW